MCHRAGSDKLFFDRSGDMELSKSYTTIALVFLSIFYRIGIIPKVGQIWGSRHIGTDYRVCHSVAAPAVEYKEGQVFGIGCKVFTIADL